jgi:DNA-binding IclR family transcriptional regulator
MPLFRGAGSKIIVANFPRSKLKRLYAGHGAEAGAAGYGADWDSFKTAMAALRRAGYAMSQGELDKDFAGVAAPVFTEDGEVLGSVIVALSRQRLGLTDLERLIGLVKSAGKRISERIALIGHPVMRNESAAGVGV